MTLPNNSTDHIKLDALPLAAEGFVLLQMELEFSSESVNYREERRKTRWQSDDASIRLSKR